MDFAAARQHMVESQIKPNQVTNERLVRQFETVPREHFAPPEKKDLAYIDSDLVVGDDRCLMNPFVIGRLLQALVEDNSGAALVIGCGNGYAVAILAGLFDCVFALESDPKVAASAGCLLSELAVDNAIVVEGGLKEGWAKDGPYDAIFIDGGVRDIPDGLSSQLSEKGRLVAVHMTEDGAGHGVLLERRAGVTARRTLFDATIPSIKEFDKMAGFVF
jgi:protein-L-isoaspartate(D-aspartate) O-methyltransferase